MADFNFSLPAFDYPGKPKPKTYNPFSTAAGKKVKKSYMDNPIFDPNVVPEIEAFAQGGGGVVPGTTSIGDASGAVSRAAPPPPPPSLYDNPAPGIQDPEEFKRMADAAQAAADAAKAAEAEEARKAGIQAELDRLGPEYTVKAPEWDIRGYEVNPYETAGMDSMSMSAQNFNPYRRSALEDVGRTVNSAYQSAQDQLARTGGLSAADRMALASQMNRQKIEGRQGAMDQINMLESKNLYDTQAANVGAINKERFQEMQNQNIANRDVWAGKVDAERFLASSENDRRREMELERVKNERSKYDVDRARHLLGKQLDYGDLRAGDDGGGGGGGGFPFEALLNPSLYGTNKMLGEWGVDRSGEGGDKWSWTNSLNPFKGIKSPF